MHMDIQYSKWKAQGYKPTGTHKLYWLHFPTLHFSLRPPQVCACKNCQLLPKWCTYHGALSNTWPKTLQWHAQHNLLIASCWSHCNMLPMASCNGLTCNMCLHTGWWKTYIYVYKHNAMLRWAGVWMTIDCPHSNSVRLACTMYPAFLALVKWKPVVGGGCGLGMIPGAPRDHGKHGPRTWTPWGPGLGLSLQVENRNQTMPLENRCPVETTAVSQWSHIS